MKLNKEEFLENVNDYNGYCTTCDDITRFGDTEPDAENYPCEDCGSESIVGIENALIMNLIEIS